MATTTELTPKFNPCIPRCPLLNQIENWRLSLKQTITFTLLFLTIVAMTGCGSQSASDTKNIFGTDNRQPIASSSQPWTSIGRMNNGCTATLIDARLVLTAAHCVFKQDGSWAADSFTFSPNMINGVSSESSGTQQVWYGTKTPFSTTASVGLDWAVFLLDRDLGNRFGWVGVKNYNPGVGDYIKLAGYSADYNNGYTGTVDMNCNVRSRHAENGTFNHDCDMTRGASGGPVFATFSNSSDMTIVGVQSGEYRQGGDTSLTVAGYEDRFANNAVPAAVFFNKLLELVNTY